MKPWPQQGGAQCPGLYFQSIISKYWSAKKWEYNLVKVSGGHSAWARLRNWCQRPEIQSPSGSVFHQNLLFRCLSTAETETTSLSLSETLWLIRRAPRWCDVLAHHKVKEKWHGDAGVWTGGGSRLVPGASQSPVSHSNHSAAIFLAWDWQTAAAAGSSRGADRFTKQSVLIATHLSASAARLGVGHQPGSRERSSEPRGQRQTRVLSSRNWCSWYSQDEVSHTSLVPSLPPPHPTSPAETLSQLSGVGNRSKKIPRHKRHMKVTGDAGGQCPRRLIRSPGRRFFWVFFKHTLCLSDPDLGARLCSCQLQVLCAALVGLH